MMSPGSVSTAPMKERGCVADVVNATPTGSYARRTGDQTDDSAMVWAGMFGSHISDLVVIDGFLNAQ